MSICKRVEHMTPEERLQSLQEWAEEQKYVRLGEGGTMPFGHGSLRNMTGSIPQPEAYTGPVRYVPPSSRHYSTAIAPPSYETATATASGSDGKKSGIKKWFGKRKEKKDRSNSV